MRSRVKNVSGHVPSDLQPRLQALCENLGIEHISMQETLQSKGADRSYCHAPFVRNCLRDNVDVPTDLKVSLLSQRIDTCIELEKKCFLIEGFPKSIQELSKFNANVSSTPQKSCEPK